MVWRHEPLFDAELFAQPVEHVVPAGFLLAAARDTAGLMDSHVTGGAVNSVDRFGKTSGTYVSPAGLSLECRALSTTPTYSPSIYSIQDTITGVEAANIAPWFGKVGLGTHYKLPNSVQYYLDTGKLGVKK
jgi:hypothetical protein